MSGPSSLTAENPSGYRIEPLGDNHDRTRFACGTPALDEYLRMRAGQDARRRVTTPFVLVGHSARVVGYYTLSQLAVRLVDLLETIQKRLPRYPLVPATLIGRLAVDRTVQGKGLGRYLLMNALERCWLASHQVASFAVIVDAQDAPAREFYRYYGFRPFPDERARLFLPMVTVEALFSE